ncbi:MAG TPA: hypothetical protein ENK02_09240 [Planctomycetes bacterium]|nr:hypothetical protein [Planctomycetota bacterium]
MAPVQLICTSISPDRYVAFFEEAGEGRAVFAYLPHIPGLNPFLLRVGDRIKGWIKDHQGKWELLQAQAECPASAGEGQGPNAERVL